MSYFRKEPKFHFEQMSNLKWVISESVWHQTSGFFERHKGSCHIVLSVLLWMKIVGWLWSDFYSLKRYPLMPPEHPLNPLNIKQAWLFPVFLVVIAAFVEYWCGGWGLISIIQSAGDSQACKVRILSEQFGESHPSNLEVPSQYTIC